MLRAVLGSESRLLAFIAPLFLASACDEGPLRGQPCNKDSDCAPSERCQANGRCGSVTPVTGCRSDAECPSALCLDPGSGGRCATPCHSPKDCPADQRCLPTKHRQANGSDELVLRCATATGGTRFLGEECKADGDCQGGLCQQGVCIETCQTDCPSPLLCASSTLEAGNLKLAHGLCQQTWLEVVELGPVTTPAAGGAPVTLNVPPGVTSLVLVADDRDNLIVGFRRIEGPGGIVLYASDAAKDAKVKPFSYLGTATVLIPGNDTLALVPGTYRLWPQTYAVNFDQAIPADGHVDRVQAVYRRETWASGLLDLHLHLAPATGIKAATAATDPYMVEMLAELQRITRSLFGYSLGEVQYFDLTAAEDVIATSDQARKLRESRSLPGPRKLTVNFFISTKLDFGYKAVAGGIPGAPGSFQRPGSGIVAAKQSTGLVMGKLAAHEIGHFLGLYHTTELTGGGDLISDTPLCPGGTAVESCPDFQNIMFPEYLLAPEPLQLSDGQRRAVQGSPWLYRYVYPQACGELPVLDLSQTRWCTGTLPSISSLSGSCGGAQGGERVHLVRLERAFKRLEVKVFSSDFAPVLYLQTASCGPKAVERECLVGKKGEVLTLSEANPATGATFIVVDSHDAAGRYSLEVTTSD
jgi:hypothetical protein